MWHAMQCKIDVGYDSRDFGFGIFEKEVENWNMEKIWA